jgi:hypothetical protein
MAHVAYKCVIWKDCLIAVVGKLVQLPFFSQFKRGFSIIWGKKRTGAKENLSPKDLWEAFVSECSYWLLQLWSVWLCGHLLLSGQLLKNVCSNHNKLSVQNQKSWGVGDSNCRLKGLFWSSNVVVLKCRWHGPFIWSQHVYTAVKIHAQIYTIGWYRCQYFTWRQNRTDSVHKFSRAFLLCYESVRFWRHVKYWQWYLPLWFSGTPLK